MRILILFLFVLLSGSVQGWAGSPCDTKAKALQIATAFVKKTNPHLEKWDRPKVEYMTKQRKWSVYWGSKTPGGFISVTVDAKTGEVQQQSAS